MENKKIILFQEKTVRRVWHDGQWFFSIIDVIGILTESDNHQTYWYVLKKREPQLLTICKKLKFLAPDGKMRPTDCANTEGLLRIIMSIPSPKAEPFKLWLAQVGKERIEEIENPELMTERQAEIYRAKGYSEEWIAYRGKSFQIRKNLTDEWKKRGITEGHEYSILTAEIAKATFGLTPAEYKQLKGLHSESHKLRDHMTDLELIYTMLGEEATRSIAVDKNAQGFDENHEAAIIGGGIAQRSRIDFEKTTGRKVVSASNFLTGSGVDTDKIGDNENRTI